MLAWFLGAAAAGWLAGESIRQRRSLGQRTLPIPPPQPFTETPDWPHIPTFLGILIYKLEQARADLARYQAELEEAERRFDALETAGASAEAIREAGAEAQDLAARLEDAKRRIESYEGQLRELERAGEEPPAPPPVYRGVPIPPSVPAPLLPWPKALPLERQPIASAVSEGARIQASTLPAGRALTLPVFGQAPAAGIPFPGT